jgi:hypothetical protein
MKKGTLDFIEPFGNQGLDGSIAEIILSLAHFVMSERSPNILPFN